MAKSAAQRAQSATHTHSYPLRRTAVSVAVAACFSTSVALANPVNPTVVHGTATFNPAGNILNITNSHNAIINWGAFSIGVNELTKFIQPSALSAVLNRVTGQDPSQILGALQSNGRVFLLNPNGIVFGSSAQVDVAGLVASTLKLSNEDFLNNRLNFTDGAGAGSVVNQGSITGGSVYLVGKSVANEGLITSPNGEVVLAAGNSVELVNPGTPDLRVEIVAPDNEARNLGTISAEAGRIGIYAGLINQSGTLNASSAVAEGGRILLKASKSATLEATSTISARGTDGGRIEVLADYETGTTKVAGTMDVSANGSGEGIGGFVETSAGNVQIDESTRVRSAGSNGGANGLWLIDPENFAISAGGAVQTSSGIGADTLVTNLNDAYGGNVTISTAAYGGDLGDITVGAPVSWSSANGLSLVAHRNVFVNEAVTNGGSGYVRMYAGWDGISLPTAPTVTTGYGDLQVFAPITTGGDVHLIAGDHLSQNAAGAITADGLLLAGRSTGVNLDLAANSVNRVAGDARGAFLFRNTKALEIGSVGGVNGITADGFGSGAHVVVDVAVTGGALTVSQNVIATGGDGSEGGVGGNAVISLVSNGGITVNNSAQVRAEGGSGGFGSFSSGGGNGGTASVVLNNTGASGSVDIDSGSTVVADGGEGGSGYDIGGVGGDASVTLTSSGSLSVSGGFNATAGYGGYGYGSSESLPPLGGAGGNATVSMTSAGNTNIAYGGYVYGGDGGDTGFAYGGGVGGRGGDAKIMINAGGSLTVDSGVYMYANGGWGGSGSTGGGRGGDARIQLTSGGNMMVSGELNAYAGIGGWTDSGTGGAGGNALVSLTSSAGSLSLNGAYLQADGGEGYWNGPSGSATIALKSAGPLSVSSTWIEASGGSGYYTSATGGAAAVTLQSTGSSLSVSDSEIFTRGGSGDSFMNGGAASVAFNSAGATSVNDSSVGAIGGDGGEGAAGGSAIITMMSGGGLTVSNSRLWSSGGDTFSGQGGAASVNLFAGGNVLIEGAEGAAWGGNGFTGGNAAVNVVAGGSITVSNNGGGGSSCVECIDISPYDNLFAIAGSGNSGMGNASIVLASAGNVNLIEGAGLYTSGSVGLGGVNIAMDNAYAYGWTGLSVSATGALSLMNNSVLASEGNAFINTGGNVSVDDSIIIGYPDIFLTVGGTVNMSNGGIIAAGLPTTIHLTLPMLASGGYFVNGIEGLVYDPLTHTGFVANGDPAVLGSTLLVTYGGAAPLTVPTDTLIVAMGESVTPPEPEKDKDVFEDIKKDKEKEAPVCR